MRVRVRWVAVGLWVLGALRGVALADDAAGANPLADDPTLIALAVALACAPAPDGVEAPPAAPPAVEPEGPELELVATVRAKSLRFDQVPTADVLFRGTGRRKTVWKTERVNLPVNPEPNVTYHDVQVRLTVTSDIEELTSMLREAKRASRGVRIDADPPAVAPAAAKAAPPAAAPPAPKAATGSAPAPAPAAEKAATPAAPVPHAPSAQKPDGGAGALPPVVTTPPAAPTPPAPPAR